MNEKLKKFISELQLNQSASKKALEDVETKLCIKFPHEYIEFMLESNGAEGKVGDSYLAIWPIEEIIPSHEGYAVEEFAPGLILFGSNGGGTAYAFDSRYEMHIVDVPFIGMDINEAGHCGDSFTDFLEYLSLKI